MSLPASAWLSLRQAIDLIIQITSESEARVRESLQDAGLAGEIIATGHTHSSYAPRHTEKYFQAPQRGHEQVPKQEWGGCINWNISRIGGYSSVRIDRAEIFRWLRTAAPGNGDPSGSASPAPPGLLAAAAQRTEAADLTITAPAEMSPESSGGGPRKRGGYIPLLEAFLDRVPEPTGMSNDALADQFMRQIENMKRRGKTVPRLPQRRYIEVQVEKLLPKVRARKDRANT
jgi:hypothetical protein